MMSEKKIQCLIIDDEALGRELIATHLAQFEQFELVASCASAIEASQYLKQQSIDLLFLDIEMPVLKGTDFYHSLDHKPAVIFTTAYRDYAVDGFDLNAVDYLLKPIVFTRFFKAIQRFLASRTAVAPASENPPAGSSEVYLFVRAERKDIRLNLSDIRYVQSIKDYIKIYTDTGSHMVRESISHFHQRLNEDFIRVHRSYIVNQRHITACTKHDIEVAEAEIPMSEQYRQEVLRKLGLI